MSRSFQVLDIKALKKAMAAAGLSQAAIAEACEVKRSTVSRWVSGDMQPSDENLAGLAGALDVKEDAILWLRGLS